MRLLLDTHLVIWAAANTARLSKAARELIENPANDLCYSVVSIWEIAIKYNLKRANFVIEPRALIHGLQSAGYVEIPVTSAHAAALDMIPDLHKDPFDRLLAAQALAENITLLTADAKLSNYPGSITLV